MKKVGGRKVMSGRINTGTYNGVENKIQLFDGLFTTGYRVVEFRIVSDQPLTSQEFMAKLTTQPDSTIAGVNFQDVRQVALSQSGVTQYGDFSNDYWIRPENMIVEDLWISAYTTGTSPNPLNYQIVLEKYEFTAWDGAETMVRNQSQAGPPA